MMSDVMFYGVLQMPYEMAMADEVSRSQFYSRVEKAVSRLKELEAENESLRRDAARYRWLRSETAHGFKQEVQPWEINSMDDLDAAIDAAMKETT